ncbi:hypothetical protein PF005_g15019 [Phytophthora fragariae]|uniref:RxLR effector protein n=1 Tax=Phytophthora fragariae TaxID=53985 RepID=A0A6A3TX18_9STRA|nr:hypothetical protein PF003_g38544 [Phytophthora fragariae]KAE8930617.1 hypothetical protein PF009_g19296 [Phytophthora fragariae]KAE8993585.1 hypothetical protein PF011_g17073 [Phytophthora fragariae]KAE9092792.1 hypothetical protein PF007_g18350 [Phytophthora fragariae]KAE9124615.1 hypothetical protein PF010_g5940 [Phytophthora fragariae]
MKIAGVIAFTAVIVAMAAAPSLAAPPPPSKGGRLLRADDLTEEEAPPAPRRLEADELTEMAMRRTPYPLYLADDSTEVAMRRTPYPLYLADESTEVAMRRTPYPLYLADDLADEVVSGRLLRTDNVAEKTVKQQPEGQGARILASDGIEETADETWNVLLGDKKRRFEAADNGDERLLADRRRS